MIHLVQHSSLDKITPDLIQPKVPYESDFAIPGEELGFQVVIYTDSDQAEEASFEIDFNGFCSVYLVKDVLVPWPHYSQDKKSYLLDQPGALPDCLIPLKPNDKIRISNRYTVLWISACPAMAGDLTITTRISTKKESAECSLALHVVDAELSPLFFNMCQYIDPFSIERDHHIPMFSDVYWRILKNYFKLARKFGIDDLMVPLFTPEYQNYPCDERIQLVKINVTRNNYTFNFDLLDSWLVIAREAGFKSFTFPVFLPSYETMMGARFKAYEDGQEIELLEGEGVESNYYTSFIRKFLSELVKCLNAHNITGRITLHFSSSPKVCDEKAYYEYRAHFYDRIKKYRVADYDVEYSFYKLERVAIPFVHIHDISGYAGEFDLSLYGCFDIGNPKDIINPLIASPSLRLRAYGALAYRYDIFGLLHMGFNYSSPSYIGGVSNPLMDTDYNHRYPSGSLSLVYPGNEEPYPSIRLMQMKYALQDYRLLITLQQCCTVNKLNGLIDRYLKITPDEFVEKPERFQAFRANLYELAERLTKKK